MGIGINKKNRKTPIDEIGVDFACPTPLASPTLGEGVLRSQEIDNSPANLKK
jgi:hypothetical protein